jgi:hypothetical protein
MSEGKEGDSHPSDILLSIFEFLLFLYQAGKKRGAGEMLLDD